MLPLSLLKVATGSPLLVELKGGDTYNGRLVSCDSWMNMNLREVICTSRDGESFYKLPSCYIRGSAIKYLRLPPELLEQARVQEEEESSQYQPRTTGRGGGRGSYQGRGGNSNSGGPNRGGSGRGRGRGRGARGEGRGARGEGRGGGRGDRGGRGRGGRGRGAPRGS